MTSEPGKDSEKRSTTEKNTKYIILNKSTIHNPPYLADISRKLLRIEYPGIVENVDKMLETLGGMRSIEMAVGNYHRRLELRFRPDDIFCKPCWGDKDYNPSMLVKVTLRQPKINNTDPVCSKNTKLDSERAATYHYEVIGATAMAFKFTRLCDFQYLPLVPKKKRENANTPCRNIYEDIMPQSLPDINWFNSKEAENMPLFFPPPIFAKFNSSKENKLFYERYKYYEKVIPEVAERLKKDSQKKKQEPKNVIGRTRLTRKANSIFVNFNLRDVSVPVAPNEQAINVIRKRGLIHAPFQKIKQMFEERPIWSKTALLHKSGIRNDRIKIILPGVAYHFPNGPWRVMWCKFSYDPRTDPNSRIYQTFDFRVRTSGGLKVKVQAKRSYSSNLMHYRAGPTTTSKFSLKNCSADQIKSKPGIDESHYILAPDVLPPARQMFYQYCDLHIPEIQDMLARLPKETNFHFKNGWLPNGFIDQCREIANKYVTVHVRKLLLEEKKNAEEKSKGTILSSNVAEKRNIENSSTSDVTVLGTPIVIDDDDELIDSDEDQIGLEGEDELDGNDEMTDTDDDEDIDLEAVDEINKIIGNMNESDTRSQEMYEEKEASDEEFDPELTKLYRRLVVSDKDVNV